MEISTNEYSGTSSMLVSVLTRVNYQKFWIVPLLGLGTAAYMATIGDPTIMTVGIIEGLVLALVPYIKAVLSVARSRKVPLYNLSFVVSFTDDRLNQFSGGDFSSSIRYEHLVRVQEDPEALLFFISRISYLMVPKVAFKSPSDFTSLLAFFREKGLIK